MYVIKPPTGKSVAAQGATQNSATQGATQGIDTSGGGPSAGAWWPRNQATQGGAPTPPPAQTTQPLNQAPYNPCPEPDKYDTIKKVGVGFGLGFIAREVMKRIF